MAFGCVFNSVLRHNHEEEESVNHRHQEELRGRGSSAAVVLVVVITLASPILIPLALWAFGSIILWILP